MNNKSFITKIATKDIRLVKAYQLYQYEIIFKHFILKDKLKCNLVIINGYCFIR